MLGTLTQYHQLYAVGRRASRWEQPATGFADRIFKRAGYSPARFFFHRAYGPADNQRTNRYERSTPQRKWRRGISLIKQGLFRHARACHNPAIMASALNQLLNRNRDHTSELLDITQHQAAELANLRCRVTALEAERQSRIDNASMEAEAIADALHRSAAAMEARQAAELQAWMERRGAPGGRARASMAARYSDGTFASATELAQAEYEARLPFIRAGRIRALSAPRDRRGRFRA